MTGQVLTPAHRIQPGDRLRGEEVLAVRVLARTVRLVVGREAEEWSVPLDQQFWVTRESASRTQGFA